MRDFAFVTLLASLLLLAATSTSTSTANVVAAGEVPADVQPLLVKYCADCHGADAREADVRLDTLASLDNAPLLSVSTLLNLIALGLAFLPGTRRAFGR